MLSFVYQKKGKDAFDLLDAALAKMPKTKAQKEAEEKKKLADEQKAKEEAKRAEKEARLKQEQDAIKAAAAKGIVLNHTDDLFVKINNRLEEDDFEDVSGLDGALDALSMGGGKLDEHPERRQKVRTMNSTMTTRLAIVLRSFSVLTTHISTI